MDSSRSVSASLTSMLTASGRQQAHCARQLNRSVFQNPPATLHPDGTVPSAE